MPTSLDLHFTHDAVGKAPVLTTKLSAIQTVRVCDSMSASASVL